MQDKQEGERKGERKGETSPPRHDLGAWVTQKTSERPQILQEAWMQQRSHEWVFCFFFFSFIYQFYRQALEHRASSSCPPAAWGSSRGASAEDYATVGLAVSKTNRFKEEKPLESNYKPAPVSEPASEEERFR